MPRLGPPVGDGKDEVGLEDEGNGNEHDVEGIAQNGLTLERKKNNEGEQQSGCGVAVEFMHEDLLKVLLAPALDDRRARDDACNERKYHKEQQARFYNLVRNTPDNA